MATMQGMEGTISEAGPGGYQLEQPPVIQSHLWKRMPEKFLKGEPKVLGVVQILIAMTNLSLQIIKMSAILPLSDTHSVSGLDVYIIGRPVMGPCQLQELELQKVWGCLKDSSLGTTESYLCLGRRNLKGLVFQG
uniref:Uncharacterized protein n=1 Tax=Panthera leo TaxID=9689 RepID=A0A8C8WT79_PANLE